MCDKKSVKQTDERKETGLQNFVYRIKFCVLLKM
jgi:hypothetical protein